MTATEVLRRLLDERGVEWQAPTSFDGTARYDTIADGYWFHEFDGKITVHGLTPEQAIAATLGNADLAAQNAKLRELVRTMDKRDVLLPCMFGCNDDCRFYGGDTCTRIASLMRELGIEVEA